MGSLQAAHRQSVVFTSSRRLKKASKRCQAVQKEQLISNRADAGRLLQRVAAMIADQEALLPYDREAFNLPLAIWSVSFIKEIST